MNIQYADPPRCVLDVHTNPKTKTKNAPVIVVLHGGAWFLGSKSYANEISKHLVDQGFVVVAPCYRLTNFNNENIQMVFFFQFVTLLGFAVLSKGKTRSVLLVLLVFVILATLCYILSNPRKIIQHPVHANDVSRVVFWTYQNIEDFGGNRDQITILGHSAGAHLAALVSCSPRYLRKLNAPENIIKATVCICGVFSDKRMKETRMGTNLLRNTFGDRETYTDAFPIYHVQPNTPPHLLINASRDYSLMDHTFDFFFALREQGVYVRSIVYPNTTHFGIITAWESHNKKVLLDIVEFLRLVHSP